MTDFAWGLLTAAGGTLALTLIVTLAIGINALTLLFLGSAIVTLERFARVARRWRSLLGFGLVWAAVVGGMSLYWNDPAELAQVGRLQQWAISSAAAAVAIVLASALLILPLRALPQPSHFP